MVVLEHLNTTIMFKRLLLPIFALSLFLVACEAEETEATPEGENTEVTLLGVWNYRAYIDNDGEELATDCERNQILEFLQDGTFRFTYYDDTSGACQMDQDATGNWEYVSDTSIELDYGVDSYTASFSINGDLLTLTIDEGEGEYQERYQKL